MIQDIMQEAEGNGSPRQGIYIVEDGYITYCSEDVAAMLGAEPSALEYASFLAVIRQRVENDKAEEFQKLMEGRRRRIHFYTEAHTGSRVPINMELYAQLVEDVSSRKIMGFMVDVTEKQVIESKLQDTLKDLADMKYALDQSSIVAITDQKGRITYVNDKFCEISGYTREELIGNTHRVVNSGGHDREFFKEMWRTIGSGNVWKGELRNQTKEGSYYWVETTIVPVKDETGKPYQYLAIRNDITDNKKNEETIRHMAYYDHLTGLANRRLFDETLHSKVETAEADEEMFGMMLIDLDGFKYINDTLGHLVGDKLLVEVARRLDRIAGSRGFTARIGGDEFAVILKEMENVDELKELAEAILAGFQEAYLVDEYELNVTGSIGASVYPESGRDAVTMTRHADLAMYRVKGEQKNEYRLYSAEADEKTEHLFSLQNDLNQALEEDQFHMVYQPRVNPGNGTIQSMEALLRWDHPEHGSISPGEFLPLAEKTTWINDIGDWVMRAVSCQIRQWQQKGLEPVPVSINLSANQLLQTNVASHFLSIFQEYNVEPGWLELEITESMLIENESTAQDILESLQEHGVRIALDDFGTGYSALSYLQKFPVDTIKLDRSLVQGVSEEDGYQPMADTVVYLGHSLGMSMVAEGVEYEKECRALRSLGVDEIQGCYFSRPLSTEEVNPLLESGVITAPPQT
ncbi:putative bifunctional diguanylate cyclase/phosphodiesterase [Salibacterium qingdaonense]|uniref:PAS domain S-box-containing protein/diguanylate cyclase (GGDEF) domain-containing protein n=1 Tax=Salibacterium qingdaonense TaxID=266892 RepID=A0A1I4LRJ3_9BACI|nr:bifunctional diguanylate cyclase/phosphodiesterase [Salibacterium qingdaonense]SFL93642.1 PAS domain S-box-containing protein/diguanylate cyclase (GGDEF) domain-containing protein [Salibacterium qingdaonense]